MLDNRYRLNERTGKIVVVLPAYNEEAAIAKLLDRIADVMIRLPSLEYRVIVVDDGSTDSTASIIKSKKKLMPVVQIKHDKNIGFGTAIRDGFLECATLCVSGDIIISLDADNTHTPSLIPEMVIKIQQGYDVVTASRYQNESKTIGVPMLRQFMSLIASFMFRLLFPISGVKDYTCGYRAYRAEVIKNAFKEYNGGFIDQDGFQATADILLKLRKMDLNFGEVPLLLRYDYKMSTSKMNLIETIRNTFILVFKKIFSLLYS